MLDKWYTKICSTYILFSSTNKIAVGVLILTLACACMCACVRACGIYTVSKLKLFITSSNVAGFRFLSTDKQLTAW